MGLSSFLQALQPFHLPHRRTGIVYNVTPHAVGVIINKVVGNRYIEKRVNLRIEHIRHSKCRQEFLDRVKRNHDAHAEAKVQGSTCLQWVPRTHSICSLYYHIERVNLRRVPVLPRGAYTVSVQDNTPQTIVPVPYETTI